MKNISKNIIISISLLLTICGVYSSNTPVQAVDKNGKVTRMLENSTYKNLSKNSNWKNINKYWKKLNQLSEYNDFRKISKIIEKLEVEFTSIKKDLASLVRSKLLSREEANSIENLIQLRLEHLKRLYSGMTCYKMTTEGSKLFKSKSDLEQQYSLLEKLYNEKKITQEAYDKSYENIQKELNTIKETAPDKMNSTSIDRDLIDAVILLNK